MVRSASPKIPQGLFRYASYVQIVNRTYGRVTIMTGSGALLLAAEQHLLRGSKLL